MTNKEFTSKIIDIDMYKTEIAKNYTTFLSQYPEIFSDLCQGSDFNFAIYNSLESYEIESPVDVFHVYCNGKGIEIKPGKANESDLELALSIEAIEKLMQTKSKEEYTKLLGNFYSEPDEEQGWIDFVLHKRTRTVIDMGYGRFAKTAGILKDDDDIY